MNTANLITGASTQTVLAGGRYDGLAKILGSKEDIPGVG